MKKTILAITATVVVNNAAFASALTPIVPVTAVNFNNAANLNSVGQRSLATQIQTMTNNLNNAAASLGVTNQVQWTGSAVGGASSNIATDLGNLFQKIDNPYWSSGTQNLLSFDAGSWTLSGSAPTLNSGGCDLTCVITQANLTARNIGLQTTKTITDTANVIGGRVVAYNAAYAPGGSVTAANLTTAQNDFTTISNNVTNTRAAVTAARGFNFASAFNTAAGSTFLTGAGGEPGAVTGVASTSNGINGAAPAGVNYSVGSATATNGSGNLVTPTGINRLKTNYNDTTGVVGAAPTITTVNGVSVYTIGGRYYESYTDYVAGNAAVHRPAGGLAISVNASTTSNGNVQLSVGTTIGGTVTPNSTADTAHLMTNGGNYYFMQYNSSASTYRVVRVTHWVGATGTSDPYNWYQVGSGTTPQAAITAAGL